MSIATRPSRSARKVSKVNAPLPADDVNAPLPTDTVDVGATLPADPAPADPAPDMQTVLARVASTPIVGAPVAPSDPMSAHATRSARFANIIDDLGTMIRAQTRAMVAFYVERGRLVLDGVNVKVAGAIDKKTRADLRAAAIKACENVAITNYDPTAEPAPKLNRWIACATLADFFPDAVNLPSVRVAEALAETITRVDPPVSHDAPDTYAMKTRYDRDAVASLVTRAVRENLTEAQTRAEIEFIGGRVVAAPDTAKVVNPIDNASKLAGSVWEKIADKDVDPFTFFEDFVKLATQFGFGIADTRDNMGARTHKLLKMGK